MSDLTLQLQVCEYDDTPTQTRVMYIKALTCNGLRDFRLRDCFTNTIVDGGQLVTAVHSPACVTCLYRNKTRDLAPKGRQSVQPRGENSDVWKHVRDAV